MLWFRNLIFYRLSAEHTINAQALNDALLQRPFVACGAMDMESCGWVAPARHALEEFAFTRQDAVLIALKVESKILPAAAVKDELDIRVQHIEAEEKRKCGRKEIKKTQRAHHRRAASPCAHQKQHATRPDRS
ncbi:recombination-associated protein RdgC [Deefgea sp. CFH1-16]|uniref:recombination-associated protein RdgC n=1 Tax=Deefgea sp. CFH1-16 TaxID=2675457 RepID=UPI0015F5EB9F|nr:recombination-associated protein RdgC [Deefgea sp. CFH1-16]MBM5575809.1 hypothetical protein [Deefgea sp. CFH1-16]